ncbi:MAK10-like protein [Tanacetum coccineum]
MSVPLRSDTIRLVQNGCSFHGLRSEDPNQHLKDFLKLLATGLNVFQHGSHIIWEDLTLVSLLLSFHWERTVKLRTISECPSTSDRRLIEIENQVQCLMEAHLAPMQPTQVNKITSSCEICYGPHDTQYCMEKPEQAFVEYASSHTDEAGDRMAGSLPSDTVKNLKLNTSSVSIGIGTKQTEEPKSTLEDEFQDLHLNLPILEVLAHALIYNVMLDKYVESLELGKNGSAFVQEEVSAKMEDPRLFTLPCRLGDSKPFNTLADLGSLADGTKSYPVGIVKDVEVRIGKLKLLNDFYVIDMKKDPKTPLLVGRGFLATANVVIDYRKTKIADKPPKDGDGAWHAKIRIIDLDGEEFTKTLQSILTTRKLSERESPRVIFDEKKLESS